MVIGDAGMGLVQLIASSTLDEGGLGCVFRPQPNADVGVDGHLEIRNQTNRQATGRFLGVQVKSGASYFSRPTLDGWIVRVRPATVEYWRNYAVPVILVLVDTLGRSAYWTSVSDSDFLLAGGYYKILVPRANRFDSSSAEAIRAIAPQAPPSLASQIGLPGQLASEEADIREALKDAATPQELSTAAERAIVFARSLRSAGRSYDAAFTWRQGVAAYIQAGERDTAFRSLAALMAWLVRDLREADFALTTYRDALAPRSPQPIAAPLPPADDSAKKAELIKAYAEAVCGAPDAAAQASQELRASLNGEVPPGLLPLRSAASDLRAADALARGDHVAASQAYAELADSLPNRYRGGAMLRSRLHAGLSGQAEAQVGEISALPGEAVNEIERSLCLGWLRASLQDLIGARNDFLVAAAEAMAANNPYVAMRAFRNAERCERKARLWPTGIDSAGHRAHRLEPIAAQRVGNRVTHARFLHRIENRLARGELRQAFIGVREAAFYSWHDIDPAAFEDVQVRYAAVMRAAAIDTPTPELIIEAVKATVAAHGALDRKENEVNLERFNEVLGERLVPTFAAEVWQALEVSAQNADEIAGALAVAEHFGDAWQFADRGSRIATLVRRALALGFGTDRNGPAAQALALIVALEPPLDGADAAAVRDDLALLLDATPWNHVATLLNAIAVTAAAAPTPGDGGEQLGETLIRFEQRAAREGATPQWYGALAMLHGRATGQARERIAATLQERVQAASGGSAIRWYAAERAIAGGLNLPDALADRYLTGMAELLEALRAQTRRTGMGVGASDVGPLTLWSAQRASLPIRERALSAGIAFLLYPEHLLHERIRWIPFVACLARYTPPLVNEAADALISAARGGLAPSGAFDSFTNPFAFFRITGHTPQALRSDGISWLATLMPTADEQTSRRILEVLSEAAGDAEPDVRLAAAVGASWVSQEEETSAVAAALRDQVLVPLTGDRVSRVALAAHKAVNLSVSPGTTD